MGLGGREEIWKEGEGYKGISFSPLPICASAPADLEYSVEDNPEADGGAAVEALLGLVAELLLEKFGLRYEARCAVRVKGNSSAGVLHCLLLAGGVRQAWRACMDASVSHLDRLWHLLGPKYS